MEKDKKNEIPAWLQKDYVPVSVDIERAYEQDLIKYGRAEYDNVYLPCKEYFYSDQYRDEIESFVAIKDGKIDFYEYWTCK